MALIPTVESSNNINQLMEELGFKDIAKQSIWYKKHAVYWVTIQNTMGETEKHQDLWHLKIERLGKLKTDISSPSLGEILKEYFAWLFT
jgi:hypothetical protein